MPVFPLGGPTAIIALSDVLPHLNMSLTETSAILTELQGFIDDTVAVIEDIVGHVVPATFDEFYNGGDVSIQLRQLPVLSITSVTEIIGITGYTLANQPVGQSTTNFAYSLEDPAHGIVTRRGAGGMPYPFYRNTGNIEIVYTAGRTTVPANIRLGALELVRHLWQNGQQAAGRVNSYAPGSGNSDDNMYSTTPSGYLVPDRVKELLQPSLRPLVIA